MYYVYILECADTTLYVGSTNDVEKRVTTHNTSKTAAKYTRARRPVILRYVESFETKSEALKREIVLKKLSRKEKLDLITSQVHPKKKSKKK
jgi:putative endonuclease